MWTNNVTCTNYLTQGMAQKFKTISFGLGEVMYSPSTVQEFLVEEIERQKILSVYKFCSAYREIKYKKLSHPGHWAPKKLRGSISYPYNGFTHKPGWAEPRKERQYKIKKLRGSIS